MICNLCPRKCGIERENTLGFCKCNDTMKVALIAPHYFEEPCISGDKGTGAVFFSGCTLKCVYCQNYEISHLNNGRHISPATLSEKLKELENMCVHSIEFVSATQYIDKIIETLDIYRPSVPLIYNCGGFESIETLKKLEKYIDIYMPDFKYSDDILAEKLSNCKEYTKTAINAISEMLRQQSKTEYNNDGIMQKGVIIRHLVLPNHVRNSIGVLKLIKEHFGDNVTISLMGQYVPHGDLENHQDINRKITSREYNKVLNALIELGLDGYAQDLKSANKSYIPQWDY